MDRGFLFGDGVYELIPVYKSRIFLLDKHLARLRSSLNHINIDSESVDIKNIGDVINDIIEKNKIHDSFVYVHITRGAQSPRNHVYQSNLKPTILVMGENYNIFSKDQIMSGFQATVQTDFRWTKSHIKSISLLGNVLLKNHANDNNFYETLLIRNDLLTEGAASNVFIVEDDKVIKEFAKIKKPLKDEKVKQVSEYEKQDIDVNKIKGLIAKQYEDIGEVKKKAEGVTQSEDKSMKLSKLSVTTEYAVRHQIYTCWSVPTGLPYSEDLLVTVKLNLEKNGIVKNFEMLDHVRMNTPGEGAFYQIAQSVIRAIRLCNPIKNLPS